MHQVPREDQLELADAMAAGARQRPQAFGTYFSEDGGSCALGAAYEGAYWLPLNAIILHLNDDHHWTREQIVEWLRRDESPVLKFAILNQYI